MHKATLLICGLLTACAPTSAAVVPGKITPPPDRLMQLPKGLPALAEGESIYDHAAMCRAEYGRVASTVAGLQRWVVIVAKIKPKPGVNP